MRLVHRCIVIFFVGAWVLALGSFPDGLGVPRSRFETFGWMGPGWVTAAAAGTDEAGAPLDAATIAARVDANRFRESVYAESRMIIRQGRRELVKEMIMWGDGDGDGLVEFVNPADRGTKYLKLGEELWMFFPDADDLVRISGHMLRQGFMGSDFSYEDTMENKPFLESYGFTLDGEEACGEHMCYVLEATALPGTRVTYAKRRLWVDRQLFVVRKEELYAASGRLLKTAQVGGVVEIGGRYVPTQVTMVDVLRQNSSTTMVLDHLELDVDIPAELFSLQSLMR